MSLLEKGKNTIQLLERGDGSETTNKVEIGEIATSFFKTLFASNGVRDLTYLLSRIKTSITMKMNDRLLSDFTKEEVFKAVKSMEPTKAPGVDGYPTIFFQRLCHIVWADVTDYCLKVLNKGMSVTPVNHTKMLRKPLPIDCRELLVIV